MSPMPKVQKGNQEMKLHFTHTHTIDLPLPLLPLTDAPPYNKWRESKSRSKWVPGGQLLRGVPSHTHTFYLPQVRKRRKPVGWHPSPRLQMCEQNDKRNKGCCWPTRAHLSYAFSTIRKNDAISAFCPLTSYRADHIWDGYIGRDLPDGF